jgi:hypothetical protein
MNRFSSKILLLVAALLVGTACFAQSIYFNYTNGTTASYALADVRKITFDDDVINLHFVDGSLYSWNVSDIGYYQYDESQVNVQEWLNQANTWEVSVYPNPTDARLNLQFNVPAADVVSLSLMDAQGKLILEKKLGTLSTGVHQEALDLGHLPQGMYVCRIAGRQHTITKQIVKQ